jgi:hypothetical protein
MRTDKDISAQRTDGIESVWANVLTLEEILGFTRYKSVDTFAPIDTKNKLTTSQRTEESLTLLSVDSSFDCVSITGLSGETLDVVFKNAAGTTIYSKLGIVIDSKVNSTNTIHSTTTEIVYCTSVIPAMGTVTITIKNTGRTKQIRIGEVDMGLSIAAGLTNIAFSNSFIDFSPKEQDQWGEISYVNGNIISDVYKGTCDVDLADYDKTTRLFKFLAGNRAIFDGSDNTANTATNSTTNFAATKICGRVKDVSINTQISDGKFKNKATYSFTVEGDV